MNQDNHINNYVGLALDELYRIFKILNEKYYSGKLEYPLITIQKTKRSGDLGWFTLDKVWENRDKDKNDKKYEINICAEYLNREPFEIVETLQHEMVHYANKVADIKDCSGNRHNKKFKTLAEQVGLVVEKDSKYGYGITSCSEHFKDFINSHVEPNKECFLFFRNPPIKEPKPPREKKIFKYICPQCHSEIKAKPDANVFCGICEVQFEQAE